jgi:hypothetical protein
MKNQEKEKLVEILWSGWFTISIIVFLGYLYIGTLEGSKEAFPNWPYYTGIVIINLIICTIIGIKKR